MRRTILWIGCFSLIFSTNCKSTRRTNAESRIQQDLAQQPLGRRKKSPTGNPVRLVSERPNTDPMAVPQEVAIGASSAQSTCENQVTPMFLRFFTSPDNIQFDHYGCTSFLTRAFENGNHTYLEGYTAKHCIYDESDPIRPSHVMIRGVEPDIFEVIPHCHADIVKFRMTFFNRKYDAQSFAAHVITPETFLSSNDGGTWMTNPPIVGTLPIGEQVWFTGYSAYLNDNICNLSFQRNIFDRSVIGYVALDNYSVTSVIATGKEAYGRPETCDYTIAIHCYSGISGGPIGHCGADGKMKVFGVNSFVLLDYEDTEKPLTDMIVTAIPHESSPGWSCPADPAALSLNNQNNYLMFDCSPGNNKVFLPSIHGGQ
jgi:hypothetical protein